MMRFDTRGSLPVSGQATLVQYKTDELWVLHNLGDKHSVLDKYKMDTSDYTLMELDSSLPVGIGYQATNSQILGTHEGELHLGLLDIQGRVRFSNLKDHMQYYRSDDVNRFYWDIEEQKLYANLSGEWRWVASPVAPDIKGMAVDEVTLVEVNNKACLARNLQELIATSGQTLTLTGTQLTLNHSTGVATRLELAPLLEGAAPVDGLTLVRLADQRLAINPEVMSALYQRFDGVTVEGNYIVFSSLGEELQRISMPPAPAEVNFAQIEW